MRVVAVSHALPQWLDLGGRRVQTSILHTPLTQPTDSIVVESTGGIEGNAPAAHNGEVYVFFSHHYDYWTEKLGVSRQAWDWCHWGENITFECEKEITEADFLLGDIWQVGKSVMLQVCGSRVPCFKLAWRCGQKDSWLQDLAATGKCGVYLEVLQAGRIHPGDIANLISRKFEVPAVDCATITRTAFADALSTRTTMDLLVDHPDLLDMNKMVFRRRLTILHDQALVGKGSWKGWRQVRVSRVVDECPDIKSFYMVPVRDDPDEAPLAAFLPGQFTTVRLPNGIIRCWSLSAYPDETDRKAPHFYRVSIRKAGMGSTWMHDQCTPGTLLDIRAPSGAFCLDWSPSFPGRQVYASAGIGITPVISMFRAHLQHQAMRRAPAVWIHVSRNLEGLPFRKELEELLAHPAAQELEVQVFLFLTGTSQEECDTLMTKLFTIPKTKTRLRVHSGRPKKDHLRALFTEPYVMDPLRITPIEMEGKFSTVYICGTTGFERSMKEILEDLQVPDSLVLSEAFNGDRTAAGGASSPEESEVRFTKSGITATWKKGNTGQRKVNRCGTERAEEAERTLTFNDDGSTLLELAEQLGLAPTFGCRTGVCGACEQTLCKGKVAGGLQPGGVVRICVARPASEKVEIEL